ncbi:MAG: aminotransferase class IV [Verrucomicrobia bacterium]|nr:aminotransferase class IV [Verrucomicrobiota bacterium]
MNLRTSVWSFEDGLRHQAAFRPPHVRKFLAMYTSEWDAIVTDPRLMRVPVDDHLVHRGDGVFETILFDGGRIFLLEPHLTRLRHSAAQIGLDFQASDEHLKTVLQDLFSVASVDRALARVLVGRGPGGFSVDPAESLSPSLYIVVYQAAPPFMESHPGGAKVVFSQVPPKSGILATVKTCNYLPNALMKAEASRAGAHFAVGVDETGHVTESFTENIAAVDESGALVIPPPDRHLPGTTLQRVSELADAAGIPVHIRKLTPDEVRGMKELLVIGTTARVTSVTDLEGQPFPIGPVGKQLARMLDEDILNADSKSTH